MSHHSDHLLYVEVGNALSEVKGKMELSGPQKHERGWHLIFFFFFFVDEKNDYVWNLPGVILNLYATLFFELLSSAWKIDTKILSRFLRLSASAWVSLVAQW